MSAIEQNKTGGDRYRPDIDGLRAVAVLAVLGYHFFPGYFRGGFVGVDVFFVISGFLISGIILDGLAENTFSFRTFYARRVRRLFPALILVLAFTLTIGQLILFTEEFKALGKHIFGGAGFIANLLYWQESGYFDAEAATKPLLHLWSLGIEEQFYIVFPFLLWAVCKSRFREIALIVLILAASLACNLHLEHRDQAADFYSPLARFWELLVGAVLACLARRTPGASLPRRIMLKIDLLLARSIYKNPDEMHGGHLFSVLGLGVVTMAIFLFRERPTWPGHWAITPVVGTALILAAGQGGFFNHHLLGSRPAVWIGRISYPLYLWHWPILSYLRILNGGMPDRRIRILGAMASLVLAGLTTWLVERPFRFGSRLRMLKTLVLAILMATAAGTGVYIYSRETLNKNSFIAIAKAETDAYAYTGIRKADYDHFPMNFYQYFSGGHGPVTVAMIGDSHIDTPYHSVARYNASLGLNTLGMRNPNGLPLLFGAETIIENIEIRKQYNELLTRCFEVLARPEIKHVLIFLYQRHALNYQAYIRLTVDKLTEMGKKVYLVQDQPNLPRNRADYAARPYTELINHQFMTFAERRRELGRSNLLENEQAQKYMQILRSIKNATIIDGTWDAFFPGQECLVFSESGEALYQDNNHLEAAGCEFLVEKVLAPYLSEMAAQAYP